MKEIWIQAPQPIFKLKKAQRLISQKGGGEEAQIGPQDPSTATDKVKIQLLLEGWKSLAHNGTK